ncbi:M20/M25/M40 family metallo-hydrolase [Nocardia sp. CA-107356]|uniref:M20/M25/M40 family metallo-hydrolase n=1 Tax=Nocardia sp. CA-107356 TaxID=3239972 RepID=UPI003D927487
MRLGPRPSGLLAFAVLLAIVVGTAWALQPHGYRTESAPSTAFSAERAMLTVEAIGAHPHPVGTAEHDRVRDQLVGQLRKLGLDTEIQAGIGRYPESIHRDVLGVGRVENIVARIPGTRPTGTIYLSAHYDSVPSAPGANDDGVGVATVLETVRALHEGGEPLNNDVAVLLTDGEETGLFGAEAFVAAGGYDKRASVVINHEARGAGGPPLLWRLTRPDGTLIRSVAEAAPHPNTDSLSTALAGDQTSSNTDFAAFESGGLRVLDWAYAGKSAYYHNKFDDPAHVNPAIVQQMGDNTLALTKKLGDQDLTATPAPDRTYFQLPFGFLMVLPVWVITVLAVLALGALGWVIRQVRRTGDATIGRILGSAATALAAAVIAVVAGTGVWETVLAVRPEYRQLFVDPYRPELYGLTIITAAVTVLAAGYLLARRLFGATAAAVGVLGTVTVAAAVFTALAPTAAYLLVVPAFAAAVGVSATFLVPRAWRLPVLTVFVIPAAILLGANIWSTLQAGVAGAAFLVGPTVVLLGGLLLLPLTHSWPTRRTALIPVATLVTTAALAAAGLAVDRFDDQHPRTVQVAYTLNADTGGAQWISRLSPDEWTSALVHGGAPDPDFAALWPDAVASGPAPAQALSAPVAEVLFDTIDSGQHRVHLRLRSTRGATAIALRYDSPVTSLRVAGRDLTPVPNTGFQFSAPPPEGIEVELTAPAGPLPLRVIDYSWLPDSGLDAIRNVPDDIFFRQDSTCMVVATVRGL